MATLQPAELVKHIWRFDKFLHKIQHREQFTTLDSKLVTICPTELNRFEQYFKKIKDLSYNPNSPFEFKVLETDLPYRLGYLLKTAEFRRQDGVATPNMGNAAEALTSMAIACHLINRTKIDLNQFLNFKSLLSFTETNISKDPNNKILQAICEYRHPLVHLNITLNLSDFKLIMDDNNLPTYTRLIQSILLFVNNNKDIKQILDYKKCTIVNAIGALEQTSTKADIIIKTDREYKFSLKTSEGKQFGQKVGSNHNRVQEFFMCLAGIDVPDLDTIQEKYEWVANHMHSNLDLSKLSHGIVYYATLHEPIKVLYLKSDGYPGYSINQFDNLETALVKYDFSVRFIRSASSSNSVRILITDKNDPDNWLIKARLMVQYHGTPGVKFRNIVEAGPLLKELTKEECLNSQ